MQCLLSPMAAVRPRMFESVGLKELMTNMKWCQIGCTTHPIFSSLCRTGLKDDRPGETRPSLIVLTQFTKTVNQRRYKQKNGSGRVMTDDGRMWRETTRQDGHYDCRWLSWPVWRDDRVLSCGPDRRVAGVDGTRIITQTFYSGVGVNDNQRLQGWGAMELEACIFFSWLTTPHGGRLDKTLVGTKIWQCYECHRQGDRTTDIHTKYVCCTNTIFSALWYDVSKKQINHTVSTLPFI